MSNCVKCGEKIGGMLGKTPIPENTREFCAGLGVEIPNALCYACSGPFVQKARGIKEAAEQEQKKKEPKLPNIPAYTLQAIEGASVHPIGIASAHVALGTGPLSQLLSSWTDLLGEQSGTYSEKMREAEDACLAKLKIRAHEMGADVVLGMQITYTELTSGHGMLLVCMAGTAVKILDKA